MVANDITATDSGFASDNNRVYLVEDQATPIQIYNLGTGLYETPIPSPFTTSTVFSGAAWIPAPGTLALLGLVGAVAARRRRT
ncbi:MAG: PEP-CTERM sorting domain-containing protein [Planctomycetes bacterium]|nr:PEP-CTERM sorting domain-containing protein [Planctomycetota bacterium]